MKVLGIDVAKSSVVCCLLSNKPSDIREVYRDSNYFYKFNADAQDIQSLLELFPDCAILEPTGVNYSRLWQTRLQQAGVKVCLVGHNELSSYRKSLGLPDKDDEADALALASYFFDYSHMPRRFLSIREPSVYFLRESIFDLEHYARVRNAITNRLKQQLAWQFPEVSNYSVKRKFLGLSPLLWRWLAGFSQSSRYDRLYCQSAGEGLTANTRKTAKILCDIYELELSIETEVAEVLKESRFSSYIEVFKNFGFGERLQALLLSEIFPIEKFLGLDGKPEIIISTGKISGKPTKKNLSKRRFKKALGAAPTRDWSGERRGYKKTGPALVKSKLYLFILTRIAPKKSRLDNEIGKKLGGMFDEMKQQKQPTRKSWGKIRCKVVEMLYEYLLKALQNS